MMTSGRNQIGLSPNQIEYGQAVWSLLCADQSLQLDTSEATPYASKTRFSEDQNTVFLGADVRPGDGLDAISRLSALACLSHELAHTERFQLGYRRPTQLPDVLLDEAETSLRAAFTSFLRMKDPMQVEPSGVVLRGGCSIQTAACTATEDGAITAVWGPPGRTQISVCQACLEAKILAGEWEVESVRVQPQTSARPLGIERSPTRCTSRAQSPNSLRTMALGATTPCPNPR